MVPVQDRVMSATPNADRAGFCATRFASPMPAP